MKDLAPDVAQLEKQADDMDKKGLDNVSRKGMVTDSYQIMNQQAK